MKTGGVASIDFSTEIKRSESDIKNLRNLMSTLVLVSLSSFLMNFDSGHGASRRLALTDDRLIPLNYKFNN